MKLRARAGVESYRGSWQTNANKAWCQICVQTCPLFWKSSTYLHFYTPYNMSGLPPRPDFVPPLPPPRRGDDLSPRPDRYERVERRDRDRDGRYREPLRSRTVLDTYIPSPSSTTDTYMPPPLPPRRPPPSTDTYIVDTYIPRDREPPRFRERSPPPRGTSPPPRFRERSPPPRARYPSPDRDRDRERDRRPPFDERLRRGPPPRDDWRTREEKLLPPRNRGSPPPRERRDYYRSQRSPERHSSYYDSRDRDRDRRRSRSPPRRPPRMFSPHLIPSFTNKNFSARIQPVALLLHLQDTALVLPLQVPAPAKFLAQVLRQNPLTADLNPAALVHPARLLLHLVKSTLSPQGTTFQALVHDNGALRPKPLKHALCLLRAHKGMPLVQEQRYLHLCLPVHVLAHPLRLLPVVLHQYLPFTPDASPQIHPPSELNHAIKAKVDNKTLISMPTGTSKWRTQFTPHPQHRVQLSTPVHRRNNHANSTVNVNNEIGVGGLVRHLRAHATFSERLQLSVVAHLRLLPLLRSRILKLKLTLVLILSRTHLRMHNLTRPLIRMRL